MIFRQRSCGEVPADSLSDMLTWVVEQLNFGQFVVERDANVTACLSRSGKRPRSLSL